MLSSQDVQLIFEKDPSIMHILAIIAHLELKDAWLCAGTLRNYLWNYLSGKQGFDHSTDVDVIFFDPTLSYEETCLIEKNLKDKYPNYHWELKNQVYMHSHNPHTKPYLNSCDAIPKFPETCTAIGAQLTQDNKVILFTPFGLEDLLNFQVTPTPHFLSDSKRMEIYHQRLAHKCWETRWPEITTIDK